MQGKVCFALRFCAAVFLTACFAMAMFAQTAHPAPGQAAEGGFVSTLVRPGLYLISGAGGNTLLRFTPGGIILVGGTTSDNYRPLMSQVRRISKITDLPVGVLVLPDHHESRTGANVKFLAAKVRVVAHENAKGNMTACAPDPATAALPNFTFARDYKIQVGGVEVQLAHFGRAHTSGDTVVHFPNLKVVAVGELFTRGVPMPDYAAGGSLAGWSATLAEVLKLDFDIVAPAAGPLATRADLVAFKAKLDTLVARAGALAKAGVPREQLLARLQTDDLGWQLRFTGEQLDRFYADLLK